MRGCGCFLLNFIIYALAGVLSGVAGSLGVGGGGILIVILCAFLGVAQETAQLTNLLFFIPVAIMSVIIYATQGKIKYRAVVFTAIFGILGAGVGYLLLKWLGGVVIGKIFAVLLIFISAREWRREQ